MKNSEGFDKLHLPPFPFPPRGKSFGRSFPRGGRLGRGLFVREGWEGGCLSLGGRLGRGLFVREGWEVGCL
jgi:hypothetical protein